MQGPVYQRAQIQHRSRKSDLRKSADATEVVMVDGPVFVRQSNFDCNRAGAGLRHLRRQQPVIGPRGRASHLSDLTLAPGITADQTDCGMITGLNTLELPFWQFDGDEAVSASGEIKHELSLDDG